MSETHADCMDLTFRPGDVITSLGISYDKIGDKSTLDYMDESGIGEWMSFVDPKDYTNEIKSGDKLRIIWLESTEWTGWLTDKNIVNPGIEVRFTHRKHFWNKKREGYFTVVAVNGIPLEDKPKKDKQTMFMGGVKP